MTTAAKKLVCLDLDETITVRNWKNYLTKQNPKPWDPKPWQVTTEYLQNKINNKKRQGEKIIRNQPELLQTIRDILAIEPEGSVQICIASLNGYTNLMPLIFKELGLTEAEQKHILHVSPRVIEEKERQGWFKRVTGGIFGAKTSEEANEPAPEPDSDDKKKSKRTVDTDWDTKHKIIKESMQKAGITAASGVCLVDDRHSTLYRAGEKGAGYHTISAGLNTENPAPPLKYINDLRAWVGLQPLPEKAAHGKDTAKKFTDLAPPPGSLPTRGNTEKAYK